MDAIPYQYGINTRMIGKLVLAVAIAGLGFAQDSAKREVFEVASVKVSGPQSKRGSSGGPGTRDPGQYRFDQATIRDLIAVAYHVDYFQISSKAALDKDQFDIAARIPAGATREEFRTMMRNLLAERFHLKAHLESRDFPAWEIVIAKSGLKIKESDAAPAAASGAMGPPKTGEDGFPVLPPDQPGFASNYTMVDGFMVGRSTARQQPVSVLARNGYGGDVPPIIDKTGLTGKYDFHLEFSRDMNGGSPNEARVPPAPDLFTAVEQQLGLQFVPKKLPFDVVVVDSVDRLPTEN